MSVDQVAPIVRDYLAGQFDVEELEARVSEVLKESSASPRI